VYARRQSCADLEVCRPPEPLCNPRLRETATTLWAILADSAARKRCMFLTYCLLTDKYHCADIAMQCKRNEQYEERKIEKSTVTNKYYYHANMYMVQKTDNSWRLLDVLFAKMPIRGRESKRWKKID